MSARAYDPLPYYLGTISKCGGCEKRGETWFLCSYHEGFRAGYEVAVDEVRKVLCPHCKDGMELRHGVTHQLYGGEVTVLCFAAKVIEKLKTT